MRTAVINFFKGVLIGVANIIPGVSGGTIAVVLGIFDPLIAALNGFYKDFKRHFIFLVPVGLGAVTGIIAFSSIIEYSLTNHSFPTSMFFIGLVVGSIPLIYRKATERPYNKLYLLLTLAAALIVVGMSLFKTPSDLDVRSTVNTSLMIKMFFGGMLASMAMIIPGISGSFILVLLGLYPVVIGYVSSVKDYLLNPGSFSLLYEICQVLAPLAIGIVLGILIISRIIAMLMEKAYSATYFTILGLVFGSVFGIFNDPLTYQSGIATFDIAASIVTLLLGVGLASLLGRE